MIKTFEPGFYYSTIPSEEDLIKYGPKIWNDKELLGIDLNLDSQLELFHSFSEFYKELPFPADPEIGFNYYFNNPAYSYFDGFVLYSMIRKLKPKNIIEIGSGWSSCLMEDINKLYFDGLINITHIEPHPETLKTLIKDKINLIPSNLQDVGLEYFKLLKAGDILFIDSSHVSKIGSDVNYLIHEILPSLDPGVIIHFHDIFYNFEYPKEWINQGWFWNEQYILRAFLEYNQNFSIQLFNSYIGKYYREQFIDSFPVAFLNNGSSLLLKKEK